MKLFTRKYLAVFVILGMVLIPIVQWWSYQQVGEILEKYPATSVAAQYMTTVSPILPSLYVRSLRKSLVGYYYLPSSHEYVLLVRGREGKPNGDYLQEFQRLQDSYTDYFNLTSKYIRLWSETGNKSAFQLAVFMLENTVESGAELKTLKRGENVTEVLVEPPYPYRLLSNWAPLLGSFAALLLLVAGTALLISRFDNLINVFSNFRNLALLFILLIGVSVVSYGLLHERPDPLMDVHSNWSVSMDSCGARVYYLHRNAAADSILLHAAGSAKYVEVSKVDGRVRRVALALSPYGAEALLHSLSRATTVLYMYSVSSQGERLRLERAAMLEVKRELIESGGLNETAVDEVVAATLREPRLSPAKSGFCENVTVMVFVFEGGRRA